MRITVASRSSPLGETCEAEEWTAYVDLHIVIRFNETAMRTYVLKSQRAYAYLPARPFQLPGFALCAVMKVSRRRCMPLHALRDRHTLATSLGKRDRLTSKRCVRLRLHPGPRCACVGPSAMIVFSCDVDQGTCSEPFRH